MRLPALALLLSLAPAYADTLLTFADFEGTVGPWRGAQHHRALDRLQRGVQRGSPLPDVPLCFGATLREIRFPGTHI